MCACVSVYVRCELYVSVCIRRRLRGVDMGEGVWVGGVRGVKVDSSVSYLSTEHDLQFSGEVEGLVPANHAATAVVATLPIAVFTVPVVALSHSRSWTRARSSWRLGTPNTLLIL